MLIATEVMRVTSVLLVAAASACGSAGGFALVPVVPVGPPSGGVSALDPTFEVVPRITGARDPLPVPGTDVAYADLQQALGHAVSREVAPRHGTDLTVELIAADAEYRGARLSVSMVARATVRERLGHTFVAQTQVVCRDGAIVSPDAGAWVVWACMARLGRELAGWVAALPPPTTEEESP